ncbi:indole-3-glycerol phosphate synthase TrpC [Nitrospina watsonii]|uniref:indole-3-glycerol phosphate synthase TrpC n=1 Tax=Nitrospina watsonii TaxID=1323948 RepID=UPI002490D1DF|nr:indole-3-glycerol phosphate synthase TrpC [Nitrospina watsonii]
MRNILDTIFEHKKDDVASAQRQRPLSELKGRLSTAVAAQDILKILSETRNGSNIIAEIKRRTPFKGDLVEDFDAMQIAKEYADNGAAAISILTDSEFFGGSLDYLEQAKQEVTVPLLRKDFIYTEYQVYESRAFGADFYLLIATSLDKNQLKDLLELGKELGFTALVETHNEKDLEKALYADAKLLGINNRDLTTGKTDLAVSRRLLNQLKGLGGLCLVCESGIHERADIEEFEGLGMHAFLIGESLMKAGSISEKLQELRGHDKTSVSG